MGWGLHISTPVWPALQPGDWVRIVAPSSACTKNELTKAQSFLRSQAWVPEVGAQLRGPDLLCANTDDARFADLKHALYHSKAKAIWCLRGGYGGARLLPSLLQLPPPPTPKIFIGYSDATALHLFFSSQWGWPTLHAPNLRDLVRNEVRKKDQAALLQILQNPRPLEYNLQPIWPQQSTNQNHAQTAGPSKNRSQKGQSQPPPRPKERSQKKLNRRAPSTTAARKNKSSVKSLPTIRTSLVGGNLSVLQSLVGTRLLPEGYFMCQQQVIRPILCIEDVNEPAYKIDRLLMHLYLAGVLNNVRALVFGDLNGDRSQDRLIKQVKLRWASTLGQPVFESLPVGHAQKKAPLPLNVRADLSPPE